MPVMRRWSSTCARRSRARRSRSGSPVRCTSRSGSSTSTSRICRATARSFSTARARTKRPPRRSPRCCSTPDSGKCDPCWADSTRGLPLDTRSSSFLSKRSGWWPRCLPKAAKKDKSGKKLAMTDLNPQAKQMADESMVRNLAAQARAIWPQEAPLIRRYALPEQPRILDAGCGTGEAASRLAELFPQARVLGVDIIDQHLEVARSRYARLAPRLAFEHQSVFELAAADGSFDLSVCRHVIQAIPHPDRVIAELARVTRRGGYLHLIAE